MMAFAGMLVDAAAKASIKVPDDLERYEPTDFPHWHVFCAMQLGASMPYAGVHFDNAKAIAAIPDDKIMVALYHEIVDNYGFQAGYPIP